MDLNQITIPSLDLSVSVAFYQLLGHKLIVDALPRYARFECATGEATFSLHQVSLLPQGDGIILYFECDDLDEQVRTLQNKGIQFDELPTDRPWLWREACLHDPDNNRLILYHAGNNRKNPPWRVN